MRRTTPIDPEAAAALAARRRACRVTQNALALELGVSEGTISKLETARVPISHALAAHIDAAMERLADRCDRART